MPGKYNKYQKKAYKRRRKRYRNREQKLSILTVKKIAKEAVADHPETKYKNYINRITINRFLGHPSLWIPGEINQPNLQKRPIVKKIFDNDSLLWGVDADQRVGGQIFLKGFRLKCFIQQPINMKKNIFGESWYKVTLMIVRGVKGTTPRLEHLTNEWYQDSAIRRKEVNRPVPNVIWKKTITFRPKVSASNSQGNAVVVSDLSGALPVQFLPPSTANVLSSLAAQPAVTLSSQKSVITNNYIKINKKVNMSTVGGAGQPNPYYFIAYSLQPHLGVGSDGYYIASHQNTNIIAGQGDFNIKMGWTYTILYTDS